MNFKIVILLILLSLSTAVAKYTKLRLSNGVRTSNSYSGRVELLLDEDSDLEWSTVCSKGWTMREANVTCSQLGYDYARSADPGAYYGPGIGGIALMNVRCNGDEKNLLDCTGRVNNAEFEDCDHSDDVGVSCINGKVELINGRSNELFTSGYLHFQPSESDGMLHVCNNGDWGLTEAGVVCRQLGYRKPYVVPNMSNNILYFDEPESSFKWIENINCAGNEQALQDCEYNIVFYEEQLQPGSNITCNQVSIQCSEGIFRLYGGVQYSYRYTGIVELLYNGEWGAICNEGWGTEEALVLCRELGFASAYSGSTIRYTEARKGNSKYKTWLNEISCTGSEDGLSACSHSGIAPYDCSYQSYVTVDCNNGVRLVNGQDGLTGRVELQLSPSVYNSWYTTCDDYFSYYEAITLCKQLDYEYYAYYSYSIFGSDGDSLSNHCFDCSSTNNRLQDCYYYCSSCSSYEDGGVKCAKNTDITLTGGYQGVNSHSGVIEILYSGSWGRVCDDEWDLLDATVACRQLGYSYALTAHEGKDVFGVGSATIILDDLKCTGEELSLFECNHRGYNTHDCTLNENAGVTCYKDGQLRLVDEREYENIGLINQIFNGRLEIKIEGTWGTICDNSWTLRDADVACRQLGFQFAVKVFYLPGAGKINLDMVDCHGNESTILDCFTTQVVETSFSCNHGKDVAVECIHPLERKDKGVLLDVQERSHNFVIISIYDFVFFDEGVKTEYKFYKNKVYIGTTRGPFFNVTGLKSSTVYKIEVEIFHNNISVGSTFITVETSLLDISIHSIVVEEMSANLVLQLPERLYPEDVLKYEVEVTSESLHSVFESKEPSVKIDGMTAGTEYAIRCRALVHEGWGDWSEEETFQTGKVSTDDCCNIPLAWPVTTTILTVILFAVLVVSVGIFWNKLSKKEKKPDNNTLSRSNYNDYRFVNVRSVPVAKPERRPIPEPPDLELEPDAECSNKIAHEDSPIGSVYETMPMQDQPS